MLLNKKQSVQIKRFDTLTNFANDADNKTIIGGYAAFQKQVNKIVTQFQTIKNIIPQKDYEKAIQLTDQKDTLKVEISEDLDIISDAAEGFAMLKENKALESAMDFTKWDIQNLKETEVLPFVQQKVGLVRPLLTDKEFQETKVTAADLDSVLALAVSYDGYIGKNTLSEQEATLANTQINDGIDTLKKQLTIANKFAKYFSKKNKDFYGQYVNAQTTPKIPVVPTGVEGIVTDKSTGKPIAGAVVKHLKSGKTATTDANGHFVLTGLRAGTHQFEVSATGKDTQTLTEEVNIHQLEDMDVAM